MESRREYRQLFDALAKRSFGDLACAAYNIMGMPIVVTDAAFVVVAKYPVDPLSDEQWDANTLHRQIEPRFLDTFLEDDHYKAHERANHPILINWGHYKDAPRLTAVIKSGDEIQGFISALTTGKEAEPQHFEDIEMIAEAFSLLFYLTHLSRIGGSDFLSSYLYSLLDGVEFGEKTIHSIQSAFDKAIGAPYLLASAKPKNPYNMLLESYLGSELEKHVEHGVQMIYGDTLYLLVGRVGAKRSLRSIADSIARYMEEHDAWTGFSRPFDSLHPLFSYKWQADNALRVGSMMDPEKSAFHYDDYQLDIILDAATRSVPQENLTHPAFAILRSYDQENYTDLFLTLSAFVQSGYNKKATTDYLHIHRNTLTYRLDKIEELTGQSVHDMNLGVFLAIESHLRRLFLHEQVSSELSNRSKDRFIGAPFKLDGDD